MSKLFRRVVTGHDAENRAIIQSDAPPERVKQVSGNGPIFYEVWNTRESPAPIDRSSGEPAETGLVLAPPSRGTRIRVMDIPPEAADMVQLSPAQAREHFAEIGAPDASTHAGGAASRHPYMHRTQTVDYGIVLEGEITLIVDAGETTVRAGDIVIQRGTNHAWANRSGRNCRIAFILVDGVFTDGLT
jgi:mannose-6-phosphate isomerase-like protein (cupin superfamily)